ncbi:MAG: hypothetical protein WCO78_00915 [Candidatus Roizmanbacteria bacterium]
MAEGLSPQISQEMTALTQEFSAGLPEAKKVDFVDVADIPLALSLGERLMAAEKSKYDSVPAEGRAAYEAALSDYQRGLLYCASIGDGTFMNPDFAHAFKKGDTAADLRNLPLYLDANGNLKYGTSTDPATPKIDAVMAVGYVAKNASGVDVPGYCFGLKSEDGTFNKLIHVDARTVSQLALMHCLANDAVINPDMIARNNGDEQGALVKVMKKKAEGGAIADVAAELDIIKDKTPMLKGIVKAPLEGKRDAIKPKTTSEIDAEVSLITDRAAQPAEKIRLTNEAVEATKKKAALDTLVAVYKENPDTAELAGMFEALWGYHEAGVDGEIASQKAKITELTTKITAETDQDKKDQLTEQKTSLEEQLKQIQADKGDHFKGYSKLLARMMQEGNMKADTIAKVKALLEAQPSDTAEFVRVMTEAGAEACQIELDRNLKVSDLEPEGEKKEVKKGWGQLGRLLLAGGGLITIMLMSAMLEAASGGNGNRSMDDIMRMVTMLMGGQNIEDPAFASMTREEKELAKKMIADKRKGLAPRTAPAATRTP